MSNTNYICQLPQAQQEYIRKQLNTILNSTEEVNLVMSGQLCDVEDLL